MRGQYTIEEVNAIESKARLQQIERMEHSECQQKVLELTTEIDTLQAKLKGMLSADTIVA